MAKSKCLSPTHRHRRKQETLSRRVNFHPVISQRARHLQVVENGALPITADVNPVEHGASHDLVPPQHALADCGIRSIVAIEALAAATTAELNLWSAGTIQR